MENKCCHLADRYSSFGTIQFRAILLSFHCMHFVSIIQYIRKSFISNILKMSEMTIVAAAEKFGIVFFR